MLDEKIFYVTQENKDVIIRVAADCLRYSRVHVYSVEYIQKSVARFELERSQDVENTPEILTLLNIVKDNAEKIVTESMKPNLEPWANWTKYFSIENDLYRKFKRGIIRKQELDETVVKAQRELIPDVIRYTMKRDYRALRATPLCQWLFQVSGMMIGVPECEMVGIYEIPVNL